MARIIGLLKFYYELVGIRLLLLFSLMICAVGFQGLSIGLFLPILQGENSDSKISHSIKSFFGFFSIEYTLLNLLIFLVAFFFVRSIFLICETSLTGKIMANLLVDLRCKITEEIFELDYQAYLRKSSGYLNNALIVEFQNVVFSFKMFAAVLVSILFGIMYLAIPLFLNPLLILVLSAVTVPLFFIIKKINTLTMDYSVDTSAYSAKLQNVLIQSLSYYKYLKATATYQNVLEQVVQQSRRLGKLQFRQHRLGAITEYGFEPIVVLIVAGVLFYYVEFKNKSIMENIFIVYLLLSAMKMILSTQQNMRKLLNSWGSIEVLKILRSDLKRSKEKIMKQRSLDKLLFDKPIRFENVSFGFDNGVEILRNINIEIAPNSTVAFVGESGVGKTTLVNLLIGLIRPTRGAISIGEMPYKDIDPIAMRRNISYITQENVIFNDTIYNNITLWDSKFPNKNMEKVKDVARRAHIAEFIERLEKGFESGLGEGGINISGGQRQRIFIARELYKDTKMLIFDEATSSLDTATERGIQKSIEEFKGQKTIVLIAHRLSTVRNSDKIFVLKDNTIREAGTYEELFNLNGEFKRMLSEQNA